MEKIELSFKPQSVDTNRDMWDELTRLLLTVSAGALVACSFMAGVILGLR